MPLPSNVGKAILQLTKENPEMSQAQKIAIALNVAKDSKYSKSNVKNALKKI